MGDLTANFSSREFACKCGCGKDDVSMELVKKLQIVRNTIDAPIKINSGCRCLTYNASVGSKPTSSHVKSDAVDVAAPDGAYYKRLTEAVVAVFGRVGFGKHFIHVDVDREKPDGYWGY